MGFYLNATRPFRLYEDELRSAYFVDKTEILNLLVPALDTFQDSGIKNSEGRGESPKYICITRPRRFGKTVMANLISSFLGRGTDSKKVFSSLRAGSFPWFADHINQHNVISISLNELPGHNVSFSSFLGRISRLLLEDLSAAYPEIRVSEEDALWDHLNRIYELHGDRFIFVLDEWDFIYHQDFVSDQDKLSYTRFLSLLLKDKAYVELAYMTGILPIAKYSSGSELNMFVEYTMASEEKFSTLFGFTEREVDELFGRYEARFPGTRNVTREGLREWYDGYHTRSGERVYNPRSVVLSLMNNNLANYWTSSGPYDELFYYIGADVDAVRDAVGAMIAEIPVPANVREYAATSMELRTRDEILSAMVVYGFLNYSNGCVSIPNKELMDRFTDMVQKEPALGNVYRLTRESARMLRATLEGDTKTMEEILQFAHDTESPLTYYSNEAELASILRLVYLKARDFYRIEREDRAGTGYVDYIFYPFDRRRDALIIELKVNDTAEAALDQIRDRNYVLRFEGKLGQRSEYTGRVLGVGIAYDKNDTRKRHSCVVEVLRGQV